MKYKILISSFIVLTTVASCGGYTRLGGIGAVCLLNGRTLRYLVGMDAKAAYQETRKLPEETQGLIMFAGSSAKPRNIPNGKIVIQHSTRKYSEALSSGGTVTKVYCNIR